MTKKINRNDKCPCGSGLKYKKCCLDKETTQYVDVVKSENNVDEKTIIGSLKSISNSTKIADEDENGFYRIFWDDDIEKVNPIEYYKDYEVKKRAISYRDILEMKDSILVTKVSDDFFIRFAKEQIEKEKFWETKEQTEVPENFLKLLETNRKKDQKSLLKGLSINPDQLISLIFKSYKDYGYHYSRYRFEIFPKDLESKQKPKIADISENGIIKTIGETDLTKGQVKKMIEEQKVIIAHFFDKGDNWHCLFITYNSIGGKENWKDGQSHFHYISSAFGVTRNDVIDSMKTGQYISTPIHIDLLEYGNQKIKDENNGG